MANTPQHDFEQRWGEFTSFFDRALRSLGFEDVDFDKSPLTEEQRFAVLNGDVSVKGIANKIKSGSCKKIIVMSGAGISVSAGVPDFRSPVTGLYSNLQKYNLPEPQAIFDIGFFRKRPEPFFMLAKELYPGNFKPTLAHYFVRLLAQKKVLLRNYTQNIDALERLAGIDPEFLVEAHGTFASAHCIQCSKDYSAESVRADIFSTRVPHCSACGGLVKPDIVFFGESLPPKFAALHPLDLAKCDLLIIMGTSLLVQPFASLVSKCPLTTPRLLINNEEVGSRLPGGFLFDDQDNFRDVKMIGDCDASVAHLAELLGWKDDLMKLAA